MITERSLEAKKAYIEGIRVGIGLDAEHGTETACEIVNQLTQTILETKDTP